MLAWTLTAFSLPLPMPLVRESALTLFFRMFVRTCCYLSISVHKFHFQGKTAIQACNGLFLSLSLAPDDDGHIYVSSRTARENEIINVRLIGFILNNLLFSDQNRCRETGPNGLAISRRQEEGGGLRNCLHVSLFCYSSAQANKFT